MKKIFNLTSYFIIFNVIISFLGVQHYIGNKIIFFVYGFVINFFVIKSYQYKGMFFEKIVSGFIWLGFWFKLLYTIIFTGHFRDSVGRFDYSQSLYDKGLIVVIVAVTSLIFFSYLRSNLFYYKFYNKKNGNTKIVEFYKKKRKLIFFIFFISFSLLSILNYEFNIYRKGLVSQLELNFFILGLFKWLTIFGFASVSAFILFYEIKIKKSILIVFLLSSIEGLVTYSGFLSRAMIFNQVSLILGIKKLFFLNKEELKLQKIIMLIIFSLFSFFISIYIVNIERKAIYSQEYIDKNVTNSQNNREKSYDERQVFEIQKKLNKETNELKIKQNKLLIKEKKLFSNAPMLHSFWYLFANRWIGINSVLSVVSHPMLNIEITKNSLKEKFDSQSYSFYEREFLGLTKHYNINYSSDLYGIILPGFVAFSFYSGSYILLIIFMLMFYSFCAVFEIIAYKFSDQNIIFAALIGQVIAYRLIHFGYLPSQSYLLILSMLFNILIYFLVVNFFSSKK